MLNDTLTSTTVLHHVMSFAKQEFAKAKDKGEPLDPMSCFYFGIKTWNGFLANSANDSKLNVMIMQEDIEAVEKVIDELDRQN